MTISPRFLTSSSTSAHAAEASKAAPMTVEIAANSVGNRMSAPHCLSGVLPFSASGTQTSCHRIMVGSARFLLDRPRRRSARSVCGALHEKADASRVRPLLHSHGGALADARRLAGTHLSRCRYVRGNCPHRRTRPLGHAVLRRRHRRPEYLAREPRRGGALGRLLAAPRPGAAGGGDVAGDQASRLRRHLFDDLYAPVLSGAGG